MPVTRRSLSTLSLMLVMLATTVASADDAHVSKGAPAPSALPTPEEAKAALVTGNNRFLHGLSTHPHQDKKRQIEMGAGQHPFVTVLSCSDSHAPPELLFDQGLGDVFSVRVTGNVVDTDEMGSVEYGVDHLRTPLLVVMGHTKCGAVTAVATHVVVHGHLPALFAKIGPAVDAAHAKSPGVSDADIVPDVIRANVFGSMATLIRNSDAVRERVQSGKTQVVGAVYDIGTGNIEWLGRHPDEARLAAEEKKGATEHGTPHAGPEAKTGAPEHTTPHAGPEATTGAPEHGTPAPQPAPPPNLPVAFAIVTLAATIGGVISSRLLRP